MTDEELEKKAEEYAKKKLETIGNYLITDDIAEMYKDGFREGQKDFDVKVTKLLKSYGVTFIDTDSIGGLIGFHQLFLDIEKENEELKAQIKGLKNNIDGQKARKNHYMKENAELKKFIYENENREKELCILCENLKAQIEKLLKELKDKGIVKSWYYNGQFKWEIAE